MGHPELGNTAKIIKLETGLKDHKEYIGKTGVIKKIGRYGDRRWYQIHFDFPRPEILWLYRPEIELVDIVEDYGKTNLP